jgi:transcriptional regulator GlxA family with amidase domain
MRTSSRTVAVLLFDEVEVLDVAAVVQVLTLAGRQWNWRPFKIATVARSAGLITTCSQLPLTAAYGLGDAPEAEIVVVPGGYGARRALGDIDTVDFVARAGERATLVAAVGHGALLVSKAGLASGLRVAVPSDAVELFGEVAPAALAVPDARLIDAGKLITTAFGAAALDVGLQLVSRTLGHKQALAVAERLGHEWHTGSAEGTLRIEIVAPSE